MSQSRFSIVLVGVSALLRRPLVSRLRPAGFTARGSGGFRRSGLPSVSEIAAGRVDASARRVGLRAHGFRFSARTASGLPSASWFCRLPFRRLPLVRLVLPQGELAFGLTTSAFRHAPLRDCRSASWSSGSLLPLSACTASGLPLGGLVFGLTASAFRHAPLRSCPRRVGLRTHRFRFSARTDPHRRTADVRADGAHRHDTCFTSKHLSQHVNLPHRTP